MDYDNIDYDEGYSIRDIDNDWLNSNMDYEIDFDSDSNMIDYNYNYNSSTNNQSTLTEDKTNRQTSRHNNSLLDRINKNLESLETVERSIINTEVERKNDSFLDLLERMKTLNSELEKDAHNRQNFLSLIDRVIFQKWHT